jgi:hypothetical protein
MNESIGIFNYSIETTFFIYYIIIYIMADILKNIDVRIGTFLKIGRAIGIPVKNDISKNPEWKIDE